MSSILLHVLVALGGDLDAAEKALQAGKPNEALELLGELADSDDAPARALIVQGRAYLSLREYVAAVEPLMRASDSLPADKKLARDAAYACWGAATGVYAAAYLEDAKRLARRAQDDLLLADLHYQSSDFEAALTLYEKVREKSPDLLRVPMRIGDCHARLGQTEEARAAYGSVLGSALERGDLATAYRAAFAGGHRGRLLKWLDDKLAAEPENSTFLRYRGYARIAALMYAEAAADLRKVVAKSPDDLAAMDRLGAALFRHGLDKGSSEVVQEAEAVDRRLLAADPTHKNAWDRLNWLAGWYWNNKSVERSYGLLKHLNQHDNEDVNTGLNFAAMARRLGRYAEARAVYDRLLEVSPDDPDVTNDYAILLDGLGERAAAAGLWKRVLAEEPENLNALENLLTAAWERGDDAAVAGYLKRGLAASLNGGPHTRWLWFQDRVRWCPRGFGP